MVILLKKSLALSSFAVILLANALLYHFVVTQANYWIYGENSLLENMQALIALTAGLIGLFQPKNNNHLLRVVGYSFAFLGLAIFLREVDVEKLPYDIPALLLWLGHGTGRNIVLVILLSLIIWQAKSLLSTIKNNFKPLLFSPAGRLMASSFILLLLSDLFEKSIIGGAQHVFYEELMELDAYFLFLFAALVIRPSFAGLNTESSIKKQSANLEMAVTR